MNNSIQITAHPLFRQTKSDSTIRSDSNLTKKENNPMTNNSKILLGSVSHQNEVTLDIKKPVWVKAGSYFYKIWFQIPNRVCFQRYEDRNTFSNKTTYNIEPGQPLILGSKYKDDQTIQSVWLNDSKLAPEHLSIEVIKEKDKFQIRIQILDAAKEATVEQNNFQNTSASIMTYAIPPYSPK